MHHIVAEVERRGMPLELALLPVIESAFEPYAYSSARASGLWQFIPGTGTRFGMPQNWWYDGRRDVLESTRAALDYLQFLHDEFNGDWLLAIAGYNCGEGCVARAVRENLAVGRPTDFWSLRLPTETRAYVPKLLAMKRLVATPEDYGIAFSSIPNEPYFVRVDIDSQIDLKLAAELAGLRPEELFELNPAFHRWATPPQGPHHLLLPLEAADTFRQNLAQLTPDERMRVVHHVVKSGETLSMVARRYDSQPLTIRMLNDLGNGPLVVGTDLRVPSDATVLPDKVLRAAARFDGGGASHDAAPDGARRAPRRVDLDDRAPQQHGSAHADADEQHAPRRHAARRQAPGGLAARAAAPLPPAAPRRRRRSPRPDRVPCSTPCATATRSTGSRSSTRSRSRRSSPGTASRRT